jgi:hypothetical protein
MDFKVRIPVRIGFGKIDLPAEGSAKERAPTQERI